ncbi:MAG: YfhO family protein [Candidatus Brocadiia bacterium]|jgi:hypothetical protein
MDSEPSVLEELKSGSRRNLWPLLILAAMAVLFFARFLRSDTIFLMRDLFQKHYPLHIYSSEILRRGALPLWNPYTGCGEPFLANIEGAVLYPPNLLYLLLPVTLATAALVIFHTWLTAAAGYALCRVWRVSRLGSLLAATMLSFNTYWLTRIEFLPSHAAMAWFPLVLLLYALWARSRRARWIALAGLALGMQMLAGHPESVLFPLGAIALYAVMLGLWEARERKRWRALLPPVAAFAAMCALAILLAMAQILPTWELVRASSVHSGVVDPEVGKASVNPGMLATLLMPFLYGVPGYFGRYWAPSCSEYWAGSFYVGAAAIVVLVGALLMRVAEWTGAPERADRPPAWLRVRTPFLLALLAGSTLYAMGRYTPFFRACWLALPFLQKLRWPSKSMIGAVFALSLLAGLALDYLSETPERTGRDGRRVQRMLAQWWMFSLFVLGAAFVAVCLTDGGRVGRLVLEKYFNLASLPSYQVHRIPWTALGRDAAKLTLLALVAPVLVLLWSSRSRLRTAAGCLLVGLVYADLFVTGWTLVPAGSADLLVRRAAEVSAQDELGPTRIFKVRAETAGLCTYGETDENIFRWAREGLVMSWPIADRVFAVNAEGNFKLPGAVSLRLYCDDSKKPGDAQLRLLRMSNTDRVVGYSNAGSPAESISLLDYYATGSALEPESIAPVADTMPRAYVVGGPWMPAAERSPFDAMADGDFNFREAALLDPSGPWAKEFSDLKPGRVQQKVTRVAYAADNNSLAIELWSGREALLVVTDAWYPGWRATVNVRAAPIAEVNAFQRGVRVPAGNSSVVMRYDPWTLRIGILVSLAALVAVAAWLALNRSRPGPSATAPQDA